MIGDILFVSILDTIMYYFAAARLFWPEGCLRDFFGLKKAEGLLKAKKIPQTARRPKQAWLKQNKFFCYSEG